MLCNSRNTTLLNKSFVFRIQRHLPLNRLTIPAVKFGCIPKFHHRRARTNDKLWCFIFLLLIICNSQKSFYQHLQITFILYHNTAVTANNNYKYPKQLHFCYFICVYNTTSCVYIIMHLWTGNTGVEKQVVISVLSKWYLFCTKTLHHCYIMCMYNTTSCYTRLHTLLNRKY